MIMGRKRQTSSTVVSEIEQSEIDAVLSVSECATLYGKHRKTIELAITLEQVVARKCDATEGSKGGHWLISATSAMLRWGKKPNVE